MAANAAPSRRAWKFGAATMALVTVFAVAACGSDATKSAAPAAPPAAGSHSAHVGASAAPEKPLRAGERFVDLKVAEAYAPAPPEGGGLDEYRCQIIDPGLTKTQFVTGTLYKPANPAIAHHANVYAVPAKGAAAAREHDAKTPGVGWQCFGGTGVPGFEPEEGTASWLDSWFPNGSEDMFDQDVGHKMGPGSLIILQTHYNLLSTDGKPAEPASSAVRLRLKDGTPQTRELETVTFSGPTELPCAADESGPLCDRAASIADVTKRFGEDVGSMADMFVEECTPGGKPKPGNTQTCDHKVEEPATLYGGYPHMHYLGRAMKLELNPGTPKARVLVDVPQFDFDAQRLVKLPSPVDIGPGDTLRVTCTHDAGLRKQLPQLKKLPPRYVVWGDGTSDEMCSNIVTISPRKS